MVLGGGERRKRTRSGRRGRSEERRKEASALLGLSLVLATEKKPCLFEACPPGQEMILTDSLDS